METVSAKYRSVIDLYMWRIHSRQSQMFYQPTDFEQMELLTKS